MSDLAALLPAPDAVRPRASTATRVMRGGQWLALLALGLALLLPMGTLLSRAFGNAAGEFVWFANFAAYVTTPSLLAAAWNSVWTAALTTALVIPLAFFYAYALTRSRIPAKGAFRAAMLIPILAPSLLPALALITLFGNQGLLKGALLGYPLYGPVGIIMAQVFACFPHAAIILAVALGTADGRLYEAAAALKASAFRTFLTVTLPQARYGLISAAIVVFTLVMTDFGVPKVIGGQFPVLATDVYKQVVGQLDFNMGAVVGIVLLLPAVIAFLIDRWAQRQREATMSGRAVVYAPKPNLVRDWLCLLHCLAVAGVLLGLTGVAAWGSLITFWPYNLTLTLANYDFANFDPAGWGAVWTSVRLATLVAVIGAPAIFTIAWLLERGPKGGPVPGLLRLAATVPLAIPGLVLGLAYILFFNHPANPLNFFYGGLVILVVNCLTHFYTVGHLTAVTAIRQLDPEFEAVGASLRVPVLVTFARVTVPICLPAILDIAVYLFVNAMTTVSAVIFLYGPDTKLASIAVVHMDEAGQVSAAAAMACTILAITAAVKLVQVLAGGLVDRSTQAWRQR
ncbi:putative 2-aminoethylphosphonate ABC transporter permease subunit [Roseomonas hellenica]|uniref:2-aminoethylphosphonate ABC transporter permease subunit n=1 Tax=Plastoroseomonas hellenica TaxID=2687306 RepID=A0ABS5ESL9_9PROT|nr:putative 2-aminoethylphosphonate ABC transporter permease subunit [Plastoroseomonas hellenica]MBR0663292.1 putative 2-aminoethylphosphonate ABC transporter permease subunit [Plastoroseomonas hellenica]